MDVYSTARSMAAAVRAGEISARELLELHLARIEAVNPRVNAVVSLDPDRARKEARAADDRLAHGEDVGPLHGLPFAFKDTHRVGGWRTTYGSPPMQDFIPEADELVVERVRTAGAVTIGKTNVPEWAAGSHTFNPIFGTTLNPYDLAVSAGGSSGGAAVALACGMVPLADGGDMGGSLRNPASFCNVVGLRPGLGRVPSWPVLNAWDTTSVQGPLARNVEDLALLLSVQAGPSRRVPSSSDTPGHAFAPPLAGDLTGVKVALTVDFGGAFAVDRRVRAVVEEQAAVLESAGAVVEDAHPRLTDADETFRVLRAWHFHALLAGMLRRHPDGFKESLADNIRAGEPLTGPDIARAYARRTRLSETMREFFERHDVLCLPTSQVPPFEATQEYPTEIEGEPMPDYLAWMRSAFYISVTGCPAISVPAGSTPEGLPVGLQLVGPHRGERRLLEIASAYERVAPATDRRPAL